MATKPLSDRAILDALGDEALSELGYTTHQAKKWRQAGRGIPWRERGKIANAYAKRVRMPLPPNFYHQRWTPA